MDPFVGLNAVFNISMPVSVRMLLGYIICLEITRSCSLIFLPLMSIFNIYLSSLRAIHRTQNAGCSIRKYTRLQCVNKAGDQGFRFIAGTLMTVGFGNCVLGLWIVIQGWKFFPLVPYLIASVATLAGYTIVFQTLPYVIEIRKRSGYLVEVYWKQQSLYWNVVTRKQRRAQFPITFYYGPTQFDCRTETNFYEKILSTTVDVILLFWFLNRFKSYFDFDIFSINWLSISKCYIEQWHVYFFAL